MKDKKKAVWTAIFLGYAGLVLYSLISPIGKGPPPIRLPGLDKLAHGIEFALFALLGYRTLGYYIADTGRNTRLRTAAIISAFYGGLTELCQYFLPYRSASILDWSADLLGAALGLSLIILADKIVRAWTNQGGRYG